MFAKTACAVCAGGFLVAVPMTSAAGHKQEAQDAAAIKALLTQVLAKVTPAPLVEETTTRLLFPFVTNQNGFDTAISVSNTGLDSTGVQGNDGTATIYFFGSPAHAPVTTANIANGTTYVTLLSTLVPGFQGYIEIVCEFPFAHGWGFLSDIGARNLATSIPVLVLPTHRHAKGPEALGQ